MPQADGPSRLRDGKLRRCGQVSHHGRRPRDRRFGFAARWPQVRRRGGITEGAAQPSRIVRQYVFGKASHLRARPRRGILRRARCPQNRCRCREERLPLLVVHSRHHHQHSVPDEEIAMIITKKSLHRRTFLRGAGATLALPLLDAMVPASTALAATAAAPVKRLGFVYIPMGAHMPQWTPAGSGVLGELTPSLSALARVKDQITVITNTENRNAYPGTHATSNSSFLSCAYAKWTESSDVYLGTTVDQVAAQTLGKETRLPSLELAMDLLTTIGQCDNGWACVYQNNLSWSSPTTPLPAEAHPRIAFERLFGQGGSAADRRGDLRRQASLLDWVRDDIARLRARLGQADRVRVDQYPDSVRQVERRIQQAEAAADQDAPRDLDRPLGVPASYAEHARLMFDLQALALQADVTRVITFQLARETSNRTYPEIGVAE